MAWRATRDGGRSGKQELPVFTQHGRQFAFDERAQACRQQIQPLADSIAIRNGHRHSLRRVLRFKMDICSETDQRHKLLEQCSETRLFEVMIRRCRLG